MESRTIKVLCVDDNKLVADAIRIKLELAGGYSWVGQLKSADDLVEAAQQLAPDVVLLDVDMPGKDPFIALEELTTECPDVRVLMLSGHVRAALIDRAIEAGAWGYLSKSEPVQSMMSAIQRVASGEFVLGSDVRSEFENT